ncbi:alpha-methylacyl-CoA racemase isoform X1 [Hydra vulgaris]|nr:alpha-methylacyl-CoA racemase isoform X1 [Hydra vulgaris]
MAESGLLSRFPLSGIRVLELAGLAPAPFCGMVLADFGAQVTRVNMVGEHVSRDVLSRGKKSVSINLKTENGKSVFKRLSKLSDILIEPFRPGVMERLELCPKSLCALNEKLIYVRLNGYGMNGQLASKAGHDINFLSVSGVLSRLGRKDDKPTPPINLLGDFGGGGMIAVTGILLALFERSLSGKGQTVNASITEGTSYISSFLHRSNKLGIWTGNRGENLLDSGAPFYETYATKDGKYISVGAIEPQFYRNFVLGLELDDLLNSQYDYLNWPSMKKLIEDVVKTKTQKQWLEIFTEKDACVTPVLELNEAAMFQHNIDNHSYMKNEDGFEPCPAPKLSRTPGINFCRADPKVGEHTVEFLMEYGFDLSEVDELLKNKDVEQYKPKSFL